MKLTGVGRQREYCIEIAIHYAIQVETHKMQIRDICTCRPTDWEKDEMSGSSALLFCSADAGSCRGFPPGLWPQAGLPVRRGSRNAQPC